MLELTAQIVDALSKMDGSAVQRDHIDHFMLLLKVCMSYFDWFAALCVCLCPCVCVCVCVCVSVQAHKLAEISSPTGYLARLLLST